MSYILDALKKSEAERSRGVVPTLLSPQQAPLRGGIAPWLIAGALLVNAVLIAAWLYWPSAQAPASPPPPNGPVSAPPREAPTPAVPVQTQARPAEVAARPIAAAQSDTIGEGMRTIAPPDSDALPMAPVGAGATVIAPPASSEADAAPAADDVSHYRFSAHVYTSDPSERSVTMDGKRYMEGDLLEPGVRIKEITETGVLLDIGGRIVPVDVLQNWR